MAPDHEVPFPLVVAEPEPVTVKVVAEVEVAWMVNLIWAKPAVCMKTIKSNAHKDPLLLRIDSMSLVDKARIAIEV